MATLPKSKATEKQLANSIMNSANQIWLAGLGAFVITQEEGSKLFESLIKEGEEVEARTKKAAGDKVEKIKGRVEEMKDKATEQLDKLEQAFQDRVARALNRLSIPTDHDIQELAKRVDVLNESIRKLTEKNR